MNEIWKDIKGYEGFYQISNLGRVKSISFYVNSTKKRIVRNHIMSAKVCKRNPYLDITLCVNKKRKTFHIHRLVAQAFIPNPNNFPTVNHKDYNTHNNRADNLEWMTMQENKIYSKNRPYNMPNKSTATGYKYITFKQQKDCLCYRLKLFNFNKYFSVNKYTLKQVVEYRDNLLKEVMKDGKFNPTR